jgi:hypothetical protein
MKRIFLLLLILIPSLAFARFEKLTDDIDQMFERFSGYVVSVEDSDMITDLGRDKGVYDGLDMKIYRQSEPIIHPITKQVLGNKKIYIGDIQISEVFDGYSNAKITKQVRAVKPGDILTMNPPIEVAVKIEKLPVRLELLLKEELSNARNIMIKDSAPLTLTFTQQEEGGIGYTVSDSKSGALVYSRYFSDQDINLTGGTALATKDILRSKAIDKTYKSIAVGHVKQDGNIYIAAADKEGVDFYVFTGKEFQPAGDLGVKFDNIQNVELADMDEDGVDEIFVTELKYNTNISSAIYEYNGSRFAELETNMPYIFRTTHVKGVKSVLAQKISTTGNYIGMVHKLVVSNGVYERGPAVSSSRDVNIYGFGYSDLDNDGTNEVFHIGEDYRLNVYNGSSLKYTSLEEFGQTPYFFILKNEVVDDEVERKSGKGEDDPFTFENHKKYIKGRVFVNSDGNIYLVQNEKKYKMLLQAHGYEGSRFAIYRWDGRRISNLWYSDIMEPVISDYYMYEEFGRTYLFLLRNFSESMMSGDRSQFIYIETK